MRGRIGRPMLPKGSHPRLEAVLRAGRAHAVQIGADGDDDNAVPKLFGPEAADALRPTRRANSLPAGKLKAAARAALATTNGSGGDDDDYQPYDPSADAGAAPVLPARAQTLPAVMDSDGFTFVKGPAPGKKAIVNDDGKQLFGKTNPMVEDLVNKYKEKTEERREELARARRNAEECAERRRQAVSEYQQEQEAAADAAIKKLQDELAAKEALIDDMQNKSDEALRELQTARDSGSASSAEVTRLLALIEQLKDEKESVKDELAAKVKSCDEERDVAAREAAMDAADKAVVFFDPDVVAHKRLPQLDAGFVKDCFGREDLEVVTSVNALEARLAKGLHRVRLSRKGAVTKRPQA